jgi:hypothetical protein
MRQILRTGKNKNNDEIQGSFPFDKLRVRMTDKNKQPPETQTGSF